MHFNHARFVYNIGLEQRKLNDKSHRERGTRVTAASQSRELTEARREFDWLRAGSTVVQQGALRDLDRAFANFFTGRAKFPRFRSRYTSNTFVVRDVSLKRLNRKWAVIFVPKAGWLKFRVTRSWTEISAATSARVSFQHGQWYVSLTTLPRARREGGTDVVGLDRGVAVSVMSSDGEMFTAPSLTEGEQERWLKLERQLAKHDKRSTRRDVTRAKLGKLRRALNNRRHDWVEKSTTRLAETYALAGIEDLNIAAMVKKPAPKPDGEGGFLPNGAASKSGLSKAIHASQWGKFVTRLGDKMEVVKVPAAFTSQCCNECGHICKENRESQADFRCKRCGHTANADVNAAKNIRRLAVCGGTLRERAKPSGDANLQTA
ncbi:MAG: transposase [Spirochaetes bacterium]|nr:MAG: transposase [Spirochaetota bacterium]